MIKAMADSGILSKYYERESFEQACLARGMRNVDSST
jgi:hypothetical protein